MFTITRKGPRNIWIHLPNGFTVSLANNNGPSGIRNYCVPGESVEVGVWRPNDEWFWLSPHDQVRGYQTASQVTDLLQWIGSLQPDAADEKDLAELGLRDDDDDYQVIVDSEVLDY
jgi:hypothetical protein